MLCFEIENVIPNELFIIELLELVLSNSFIVFDSKYFQQIFGLILGTNVEPILTSIHMALLENELKNKCKTDPKLIWPYLFRRFIDDGIGVTTSLHKDIIYWIEKFNELHDTITIGKYNWAMQVIIWIYLFFKVTIFIWMANFRFRYIKKYINK